LFFAIVRKERKVDPLDDILPTLLLRGMVLYRGRMCAPFGVRFDDAVSGADASFHVVTSGRCLLTVEGLAAGQSSPAWLETGDLVIFPHGHSHTLRDSERTPVRALEALLGEGCVMDEEAGIARFGGGDGEVTAETVCGDLHFRDDDLPASLANPLLAALPPVLLVRGEAGRAAPWLQATIDALVYEADRGRRRPGARTVMSRLADVLFIQAVRAFLTDECAAAPRTGGDGGGNWLRALADGEIGPLLGAVNRAPSEEWTVAKMARAAGMSRSAFAERFTRLVGEPPLHYVTRWRLFTAARLLRASPRRTLAEIATSVGYGSEAALSTAFKRWTGTAPGAFRRQTPAENEGGAHYSLGEVTRAA
jgi:AraC-like DNA-binding protein